MGDLIKVEDSESSTNKPVYLFGKDIREIKCFRDSFIFGICGGFAGGLICFMATSKARFSSHIGFASLWICVLGYWFPCRYKYETTVLKMQYWKDQRHLKQQKKMESNEAS